MSVAEFIYTVLLKPPPLRRAANAAIRALLTKMVAPEAPFAGMVRYFS